MADVKQQVRDYIIENFLFGDTSTQFSDEDSFMEKGILDSTGILEVITFLEESYGIKIEDDELVPENLDSINNIASFISRKKN
ncbi:MAG: acyl carrier protein [Calditrichaceae bacterium]|nr:acyl carrier protein [Calditrichaceae bacterium]MBN2708003.1 acyl carrier protein [Calditrichaceae bacterium]RQV95173.1 MAG: acyl carrier protein [Calditrichota bacterium]